jgi:outer membrane protein assembly factor BamB
VRGPGWEVDATGRAGLQKDWEELTLSQKRRPGMRVALLAMAVACSACLGGEETAREAKALLQKAGISGGICFLPRCGDGKLAVAIAKASRMIVCGQDTRPDMVAAARREADAAGLLGRQVYIDSALPGRLPFADNYVDLIVLTDPDAAALKGVPAAEVARTLCPGGRVVITQAEGATGGLTRAGLDAWMKGALPNATIAEDGLGLRAEWIKPMPGEADDWSHWFHAPDNNPVSTDTMLKWPFATQWMALPFYSPQPNNTLVSAGRMFTFTGHGWKGWLEADQELKAAINRLTVRNAYNGEILWQRSLPENYLAHRSCAVATPETLYLLDGRGVICLDSRTGKEQARIAFQGVAGEGKWLSMVGRRLFVLAGEKDPSLADQISRYGSLWNKEKEIPCGFGTQIAAYDLDRRQTAWVHNEPLPIDSRAVGIVGNRLLFYSPGARLGCIDIETGKVVWARSEPALIQAIEAPGVVKDNLLINRSNPGMLCLPGVLAIHMPGRKNWAGFSTEDGSLLWTNEPGKQKRWGRVHQLGLDGLIYTSLNGTLFDTLTGEKKGRIGFGATVCGRMTATPGAIYGQKGRGYDRVTKKSVSGQGLKANCYEGMTPACGLLLATPHSCVCGVAFRGHVAFGSAGADFPLNVKALDSERLESAPTGGPLAPFDVTEKDWVCHRANVAHNGASKAAVAKSAAMIWTVPAGSGVAREPAAAGGLVFVGRDTGKVEAFDAATGTLKWTHYTGGRIIGSPVIGMGRVFVGAGDGFVYALEAATGRLSWRFRASPLQRRIMLHGYLTDTWPVGPGLLRHDGTLYAAAGFQSLDGMYIYALDAASGKIKWQNGSAGHSNATNRQGPVPGVLTVANGRLWMAGGHFTGPVAFDLETGALVHSNYKSVGGINAGGEVGVFGDYLCFGGPLAVRTPAERFTNGLSTVSFLKLGDAGTALYPELAAARSSFVMSAWDAKLFAVAPWKADSLCFWEPGNLEKMLDDAAKAPMPKEFWKRARRVFWQGRPPLKTDKAAELPFWTSEKRGVWATALASNAAIAVWKVKPPAGAAKDTAAKWSIAALDRSDGRTIWEIELPGEPLPNALCIDRNGNTVVSFRDGSLGCFGARGPR